MALLPFFGLVGAFTLHGAPGRTMSRHSPAVTMELSIRGAENSDEVTAHVQTDIAPHPCIAHSLPVLLTRERLRARRATCCPELTSRARASPRP